VQWFPLLYVGTNVVYLMLAVPLGRLADRWGRLRCSSADTLPCWCVICWLPPRSEGWA
jgi:hypothetical protein